MTRIALGVSVALLLGACGSPAQPKSAPRELPPTAGPVAQPAVEDLALELIRAAFAGDRARAVALTLTHEQLTVFATKTIEKADWEAEVASFFDRLAREGAENKGEWEIVGAKVVETRKLAPPADEKVKREVEVAVIQIIARERGKDRPVPFPLLFFRTDAGWRFSPKK